MFIYVFEEGPIFIVSPFSALHNFPYSLSGSMTYCSILNNLYLTIFNLVKNDFPAPLVPNTHIFAFLYFFVLYLSMKTSELLYLLVPTKIPSSSNIDDDIKGYVTINPFVKTFLLVASFIILLFSIEGIPDINVSCCLKYALLVIIPFP